jgi:hypothetical protein
MDYAIHILEYRKQGLQSDLKKAQATVDIRVMFGEETSWIQEARQAVWDIESKMNELDQAVSKLRGDG